MSSARTVAQTAALLALSACSGCHPYATDSGTDTAGECTMLSNEENYSWTGNLNIPKYVTAEYTDVHVTWPDLTSDLLCHDLDPITGVTSVGLTRFPFLSTDEIATGLTDNSLKQKDTNGFVSCIPDDPRTDCYLSEFNFAGTAYDTVGVYGQAGGSFLLSFSGSTDPSGDAVWLGFLVPTPGSEVTEVAMTPTCDVAAYDVSLSDLQHTALTKAGPWCIDWSALTTTGNQEPMIPSKIDEILIGHYDKTPEEVAAQFLDIEVMAQDLFTLELTGGTDADLGNAVSADGAAFTGFTDDGTWIVGLRCTSCTNPVPMFLTVVDPT